MIGAPTSTAGAFAAAVQAASEAQSMSSGSVPIVPGRKLYVDGDGLAYYCAGNEITSVGVAKQNLRDKLASAARIVGAETIMVLLTAEGSTKGDRYAIARRKPYQGQRTGSNRPANWQALRDYMLSGGFPYDVECTRDAEADDLFAYWCAFDLEYGKSPVIYTQDKDMRMVPGVHLDWVSHMTTTVTVNPKHLAVYGRKVLEPDNFQSRGLQYGWRWFWLQMLQGDTADNIPGLPFATIKYGGSAVDPAYNLNKVGEAAAAKILAGVDDNVKLGQLVREAYTSYYKERWLVEMLEQACLLFIRPYPQAWDCCAMEGYPMAQFTHCIEWPAAHAEIRQRIKEAYAINSANASQDQAG